MSFPTLKWHASPNFSARSTPVDLIVLHDCQGSYAGSVNWFAQSQSQVSAHIVLKEDGTEATQMVDFGAKAWHACDFNSRSIGIEMGGFAERGFPDAEWTSAARIVAYLLHMYGLPVQWAHGGHGPGFTSHFDLGKAGGGHSDPTTDQHVWLSFVKRVQDATAAGGFPSEPWGRGLPSAPRFTPAATAPSAPTMSVADAQNALNTIGYRPLLATDGSLGPKTSSTIARFQRANGIFADGKLNAETAAALTKALA